VIPLSTSLVTRTTRFPSVCWMLGRPPFSTILPNALIGISPSDVAIVSDSMSWTWIIFVFPPWIVLGSRAYFTTTSISSPSFLITVAVLPVIAFLKRLASCNVLTPCSFAFALSMLIMNSPFASSVLVRTFLVPGMSFNIFSNSEPKLSRMVNDLPVIDTSIGAPPGGPESPCVRNIFKFLISFVFFRYSSNISVLC